jgi:NADH-quinone oxidoreductase subunit A
MQPISDIAILSPWEPGVFSLAAYGALVLALIGAMLWMAAWLGERKPGGEKARPYECGVIPTGTARLRYPVPFYLVAVFFLVFDVEGAYIFTWAATYENLGWRGWLQMAFFIAVLLFGLLYVWNKGGLDWRPAPKTKRPAAS